MRNYLCILQAKGARSDTHTSCAKSIKLPSKKATALIYSHTREVGLGLKMAKQSWEKELENPIFNNVHAETMHRLWKEDSMAADTRRQLKVHVYFIHSVSHVYTVFQSSDTDSPSQNVANAPPMHNIHMSEKTA